MGSSGTRGTASSIPLAGNPNGQLLLPNEALKSSSSKGSALGTQSSLLPSSGHIQANNSTVNNNNNKNGKKHNNNNNNNKVTVTTASCSGGELAVGNSVKVEQCDSAQDQQTAGECSLGFKCQLIIANWVIHCCLQSDQLLEKC